MKLLLEEIVAELKELTGCAAVGIRILDEKGNIPYKAYEGFSQRFYESESPLSIGSDQCVCINVIKGTADPKLRFYTPGGSFYINGTTRFLATVTQEEKGTTHNVCNQFGYESVALIPLRCEGRILGLIHLADTQENKVPLGLVEILEGTAMQLCQAIQRVRAEEALRKSYDELEQRVEERTVKLRMANEQLKQEIEERKKVEDSLKESEKKLRYLSSRLLMIQETERRRVSRELHDELGGTLAVLKLRMGSLGKNLKEDQPTLREECDMSLKYIDKLFESVHRISRNLSPSILEDLGLSAALQWLIDDFGKNYNIRVILEMMDTDHLFSNETQIGTYRIIQEALTNIGKHTQAKNVSLMIKKHDDTISLTLEDDGRGFNMKEVIRRGATERGLGLATMVERAKMLGGSLDLWSQEGKGTRITLSIPIKKEGGL
jgi:signal transduction histidine kinase